MSDSNGKEVSKMKQKQIFLAAIVLAAVILLGACTGGKKGPAESDPAGTEQYHSIQAGASKASAEGEIGASEEVKYPEYLPEQFDPHEKRVVRLTIRNNYEIGIEYDPVWQVIMQRHNADAWFQVTITPDWYSVCVYEGKTPNEWWQHPLNVRFNEALTEWYHETNTPLSVKAEERFTNEVWLPSLSEAERAEYPKVRDNAIAANRYAVQISSSPEYPEMAFAACERLAEEMRAKGQYAKAVRGQYGSWIEAILTQEQACELRSEDGRGPSVSLVYRQPEEALRELEPGYFPENADASEELLDAAGIAMESGNWVDGIYGLYFEEPGYSGLVFRIRNIEEMDDFLVDLRAMLGTDSIFDEERKATAEAAENRWRRRYTEDFFQDRELLIWQAGMYFGTDLVPGGLIRKGSGAALLLRKGSVFGAYKDYYFTEIPKERLEGIGSFRLWVDTDETGLLREEDYPVVRQSLDPMRGRRLTTAHYLYGTDQPRCRSYISNVEGLNHELNRIQTGCPWLTEHQMRELRDDWTKRYDEKFFQNYRLMIWQLALPRFCSGTSVTDFVLVDKDLRNSDGTPIRWSGRHYEIYVDSGHEDNKTGLGSYILMIEMSKEIATDSVVVFLDGVQVDANR